MTTKALVVLSGGQDSTTCLFWAKEHYDEVHSICFDYGQRHRIELQAADTVAFMAHVKSHTVVTVPHILRSSSPLTSQAVLEQYTDYNQMDKTIGDRVELTFVPMRNTFFLTVAANRAVAQGINTIVTGICQEDNANYPDCRETFRRSMEILINKSLGYENEEFEIEAPLMFLSKAQSVHLAMKLKGCYAALAWSHTSYDGAYPPTDNNHSNLLRAHGFEMAGVPDPLVLRAHTDKLMDLPKTSNYDHYRLTGEMPKFAK
jgi:7-cyano-7-deazaguanine synthase